jgi:uncharacterized protein YyaL (SSP411 family)
MLAAYADAGRILGAEHYLDIAKRNAAFVRDHLMRRPADKDDEVRLWHVYDPHSHTASIEGMLEDYTYVGLGLLALYRATFEREWLQLAFALADSVLEHFFDNPDKGGKGGFFTTAADAEALIVRPKSYFDAAMPSGNGSAAALLWQVAHFKQDTHLETIVQGCLAPVSGLISEHPHGFGTLLSVLRDLHTTPREIVLVTPDTAQPTYQAMRHHLNHYLRPNTIIVQSSGADDPLAEEVPVMRARGAIDGLATAYVCERFACKLPVNHAGQFAEQLEP